ncbi:MAG TPA: DUF523 and DUF1722 domain-containing protein [Longimicrobiales bacterium]|nr:DUF523 and DUF1722 domain-containing protein [Longimicrobiales bacterium]
MTTDSAFARPALVVSQCLGFDAVRYNAQVIRDDFVQRLAAWCDLVVVCPEVEIGLGVPRPPIRLVRPRTGELHVFQPKTGRDVTAEMRQFAGTFLSGLPATDGFLLKNRSPSCGISDVKIYAEGEDGGVLGKGPGAFGGAVLAGFPDAAIEDEGRLRDQALRERFLTLLFGLARLRDVEAARSRSALVGFHASYKYVLMAYHQEHARALGRVVAGVAERPWEDTIAEYRATFARALARPARVRSHINALTHVFGHVSGGLSASERAFFLEQLDEMRAGRARLAAALLLLRSWSLRFGEPYLDRQAYFRPYPPELAIP